MPRELLVGILLAVSLTFTLPDSNAAQDPVGRAVCSSGSFLLSDLDSVYLCVQSAAHPLPYIAQRLSVRGQEGRSCTMMVPDADTLLGQAWVVTRDTSGNPSCPSNVVLFGGGLLQAPHGPAKPELPKLYDLAGRRVYAPLLPGVYFERRAGTHARRVVVLR
jgi:hypothetical protein